MTTAEILEELGTAAENKDETQQKRRSKPRTQEDNYP
jgi:hypothetical protein